MAAETEGLDAALVLNKVDIGGEALREARSVMALYAALGYTVVETSAVAMQGANPSPPGLHGVRCCMHSDGRARSDVFAGRPQDRCAWCTWCALWVDSAAVRWPAAQAGATTAYQSRTRLAPRLSSRTSPSKAPGTEN